MNFYGLEPFSLQDFPGQLSCILFTGGCNMRCGYCHNPELVLPQHLAQGAWIERQTVIAFLESRKGLLDAVTMCGGEPTLHHGLPEFLREVHDMGFKIKLDTNGSNPQMLRELLQEGILDFVAMDLKMPFDQYGVLGGEKISNRVKNSLEQLIHSKVPHEFRTTVLPGLHTVSTLQSMAKELSGAKRWVLQAFRGGETLDMEYSHLPWTTQEYLEMASQVVGNYVEEVVVRGG